MTSVIYVKFEKKYSNLIVLDFFFEISKEAFGYAYIQDGTGIEMINYDNIENFADHLSYMKNLDLTEINEKYKKLNKIVVYDPNYGKVVDDEEIISELNNS
jgi:hypothetical protein